MSCDNNIQKMTLELTPFHLFKTYIGTCDCEVTICPITYSLNKEPFGSSPLTLFYFLLMLVSSFEIPIFLDAH